MTDEDWAEDTVTISRARLERLVAVARAGLDGTTPREAYFYWKSFADWLHEPAQGQCISLAAAVSALQEGDIA